MENLSAVVARQTHIDNPQDQEMMERIVDAICQVYDPEIPVNIWELGLIYTVHLTEEHDVFVDMTLTTPMCPSAQELPVMVEMAVCYAQGVRSCEVAIIWEPPWNPEQMSEIARVELNFF